jgi:hypothetical protein
LEKNDKRDNPLHITLHVSNKIIAFVVRTTNFYDGLGRIIFWGHPFDGAYLVVPSQIIPKSIELNWIPENIGIVGFEAQRDMIEFKTVKEARSYKLPSLSAEINVESQFKPESPARISLVSEKALRIVRYLITHQNVTQMQIAGNTRVSVGMVNKVVSALIERGLIAYRGKNLTIVDMWKLLNEISWNRPLRSLKKGELRLGDSSSIQDAETKLLEFCRESSMRYTLTLFSGATRLMGYGMKYDSIQAYFDQPERLLQEFSAHKMDLGANKRDKGVALELYAADSEDIFDEAQVIDDVSVSSTAQLLIDLVSYGTEGRDWAVKLYEETIKTEMSRSAISSRDNP